MSRIKEGSRPHNLNILINYRMKCSTFFYIRSPIIWDVGWLWINHSRTKEGEISKF